MAEAPTLPKVREAAAPVVSMLQAERERLNAASTPEAVEDVRSRLAAYRAMCAAALRDPNVSPEDVALAKREAEELALDATVKLGLMVPVEVAPGRPPEKPTTAVGFATVSEVAKRCGVPESTLRRYRDMAAAFREHTEQFMGIAKAAIQAGKEIPVGRLIALVKPAPPPPSGSPTPPRKPAPPIDTSKVVTTGQMQDAPKPTKPDTAAQRDADKKADDVLNKIASLKAEEDPFAADPIQGIGEDVKQLVHHLTEARRIFDEMEPIPLEPVGEGHARRPCERDVQLQKYATFDGLIPDAITTLQRAARLDVDAVTWARAERDKAEKKRRAR